jgi:hypothetical protein
MAAGPSPVALDDPGNVPGRVPMGVHFAREPLVEALGQRSHENPLPIIPSEKGSAPGEANTLTDRDPCQ